MQPRLYSRTIKLILMTRVTLGLNSSNMNETGTHIRKPEWTTVAFSKDTDAV